MSATRGYVTAVVAGAMTAGIGAASVLATPPDAAVSRPSTGDVNLAAAPITIPIIDIGPTPGPLSIWRYLAIQAGTNPLLLGLLQEGGNSYNLPGLKTLVNSTANPRVVATQGTGYLDFAFLSDRTQSAGYNLLGGVVKSSAEVNGSRNVHFMPLLGGAEGIGARLYGTLDETAAPITRSVSVLGSGFATESNRKTGVFDGAVSVIPFNGFKAVGDGTLIQGDNETTANLGALQFGAGSSGALGGNAGVCLGSAQGTQGCGTDIAFAGLNAPINLELGTGGSTDNLFSVKFPENNLAVALGNGRFAVTGELGGTVSVGGLEFGRAIPIDFQIPRASSLLSSTSSSRQQQTVRNSFVAVPGETGSNKATASTGRHAARDAVNEAVSNVQTAVKSAVSNATQSKPRHAKPDTDTNTAD